MWIRILPILLLTGCVSAAGILPAELEATIPGGADAVIIHVDEKDAAMTAIYNTLSELGIAIIDEDRERGRIVTDFSVVHDDDTMARFSFAYTNGRVIGTGHWGVTNSLASAFGADMNKGNGNPAKWTVGRPKVAFAFLVKIASAASGHTLDYRVTDATDGADPWGDN